MALAIGLAGALVAPAHAQVTVTPMMPMSGIGRVNGPVWLLVSVRNPGTTALTINNIGPADAASSGCLAFMSIRPIGGLMFPVTLAAGQQAQFELASMADGLATSTCTLAVNLSNGQSPMFDATLRTSSTGDAADFEPHQNNFVVPIGSSEVQSVYVIDYGAANVSSIRLMLATTGSEITFQAPPQCAGMSICDLSTTLLQGSYTEVQLACKPTSKSTTSATLTGNYGGSGTLGSTSIACTGVPPSTQIAIVESAVNLFGPIGTATTGTAHVQAGGGTMTTDMLQSATITGAEASLFRFTNANCNGMQACTFTPAQPLSPPFPLQIACTPPDANLHSATLTVNGTATALDQAQVPITCMGQSASGPHIVVSPSSLAFGPVGVNTTSAPMSILVQNNGNQPLGNVRLSFTGAAAADWAASACVTSDCTIVAGGMQAIAITLRPRVHGSRMASLQVASNDVASGPRYVMVDGTGVGGTLAITSPASLELPFGTLPRNQLSQQLVTAANAGNADVDATVAAPGPFQTDAAGFRITAGASRTFMLGCMSATAGTFDDHVIVDAANAYTGAPRSIHVTCTVAATDVQVQPTAYAFGEVRRGSAMVTKTITVTNPATASATVHVTRLALANARPGLVLVGGVTGDMALAPGASLAAQLVLTPTTDGDLAGATVEVVVDGTALSLPVTGKVVTPHSSILPPKLDLGTACVGASVRGRIAIVNDGSATVIADPPVMDHGFAAAFHDPTSYPASLAPGGRATIDVLPMSTTLGTIAGTLAWHDDVPADYSVAVGLQYIDTGLATSPAALVFGEVAVGTQLTEQEITIENCDPGATLVEVHRVAAQVGSADGWTIVPGAGYSKMLAMHDTLPVAVTFEPKRPGHYEAMLEIVTPTGTHQVALVGDATGPGGGDGATSFYACTCSGGAPASTWLVAFAVVLIVWRKRR